MLSFLVKSTFEIIYKSFNIGGNIVSNGKSFGKAMSFEQHVENYPDKDELKQYKRLQEISGVMQSGATDRAIQLMVEEFESPENAISLFEALKKKVFKGWEPLV
ncbi:MAG: hypothetical protein NTX66_02765 [Candidatus Falkowbacteria bacterium]|nr:hypothetical protein [Candidatus Falkowbacteria bacterium]